MKPTRINLLLLLALLFVLGCGGICNGNNGNGPSVVVVKSVFSNGTAVTGTDKYRIVGTVGQTTIRVRVSGSPAPLP